MPGPQRNKANNRMSQSSTTPPESDIVADFTRYASMVDAAVTLPEGGFSPTFETATAVQVDRGLVLARAVQGLPAGADAGLVERLIELAPSQRIGQIAFVDRLGHHRPLYRPLTLYAWLVAYQIRFETLTRHEFARWDEALRLWCDLLEAELETIDVADSGNPASRGASIGESAWTALALHLAGKVFVREAWVDLSGELFGRLARGQRDDGSFLIAASSDHPEIVWYHELAILHASASYAVQAEDRSVARAVARSAGYLVAEVQPDHATLQPWGVFPFIWAGPETRPMADHALHSASLRQPLDAVSLILLADALYCLKLFL